MSHQFTISTVGALSDMDYFQDLGISVAYWISFGLAFVDNGYSDVRWRFLLAFQCFPALLLVAFVKMLPDSPRYLASVGRNDEARDLLNRIRKDRASQEDIDREYLEIIVTAEGSKRSSPIEFVKILFGKGGKPGLNLGRRAWLCVWLQIMASWTGITVSYAISPVNSHRGVNNDYRLSLPIPRHCLLRQAIVI